jgi:hypothetical protein
MDVTLLTPDDAQWSDVLDRAAHDVYHLPAYVRLSATTTEPGEPVAVLAATSRGPWLLPLVLRDVPGAPGVRDAVTPYGYPGPIGALGADAASAAAEFLREQRVVSLFARAHPLLNPAPEPFTGIGDLVEHGETVTVDLSLPEDELWRQTRSRYRSEINRAEREGHRPYFDENFEHLDTFVTLYLATMERVEATPYYLFGTDYFRGLKDVLDRRLHLCVVDIDGEIAAGALFTEIGGIVQYHLSASDDRFSAQRPTKTMIHFVRTWAKARGNRWLHLGGGLGGGRDSLFHFKAGFSKLSQPFRTWRVVTDEPMYLELVRAARPTSDGRDRSGYFPEYRQPVD